MQNSHQWTIRGEVKAWALSMLVQEAMVLYPTCYWLTIPAVWSLGNLSFWTYLLSTWLFPWLKEVAFSVEGKRSTTGLNPFSNCFHAMLEIKPLKVQHLKFWQLCSLGLFWQLSFKPMRASHPATWPKELGRTSGHNSMKHGRRKTTCKRVHLTFPLCVHRQLALVRKP